MSGVYILETVDGFRVAYAPTYELLYGPWDESIKNFTLDTKEAKRIFGNSIVYATIEEADEAAWNIAKTIPETDDGTYHVKLGRWLNFNEF